VLTESAATYEAIEEGFNWLVDAQENENTLVVAHYSGHRGQIMDDNGDEANDKDEVITQDMYDDFALAVRDNQLDEWLSRLESKHVVD